MTAPSMCWRAIKQLIAAGALRALPSWQPASSTVTHDCTLLAATACSRVLAGFVYPQTVPALSFTHSFTAHHRGFASNATAAESASASPSKSASPAPTSATPPAAVAPAVPGAKQPKASKAAEKPKPSNSKPAAPKQAQPPAATSSPTPPGSDAADDSVLTSALSHWQFRPPRFQALAQDILHREMSLKLGRPTEWDLVPHLSHLTLSISALTDTRLSLTEVDKKDLFLSQLALEHLAGGCPVEFTRTPNSRSMTKATGVAATLTGAPALEFLEKLVHVVLPNQTSFEGLAPAQLLTEVEAAEQVQTRRTLKAAAAAESRASKTQEASKAPRLTLKKKQQLQQQATTWVLDLRVDNMLLFPDFEPNFELFEPLRSMQVRMVVQRAVSAEAAAVYLSGFGIPLRAETKA